MHTKRGSTWKLWFIIIALVLVIAILGFLCVRFFLNGSGLNLFGSSSDPAVDSSLSTQVAAQDAKGKDVTQNLSVTAGTRRPDTVDSKAALTLLEIDWTSKKSANFPMIITVSDPSFPDNDGLAVYHYSYGSWELLGTYLIANHSVSFQADSLSPFAFQIISSNPEPTATPEPTPEPTATPEPTPEPIDYGTYDKVQVGEFVQVDSLSVDGAYVIALVDDADVTKANEQDENNVTFFDAVQGGQTLEATVLINYDGTKLAGVDVQVTKGSDGRYTITDTVTEGMLWTAVLSERYNDADRFSLQNNGKFLNLDEDNTHVVLDDNATRTRWLAQTVTPNESAKSFPSLTYRIDSNSYYIENFETTLSTDGEGTTTESDFSVAVGKESENAKQIVIFQLRTAVPTNTPGNSDGLTILTNTPSAVEGLDATPAPTATPNNDNNLVPIDPTAPPSSTPPASTATPTPTAAPTAPPEETMNNPGSDDNSGGSSPSDSNSTPEPVEPDDSGSPSDA